MRRGRINYFPEPVPMSERGIEEKIREGYYKPQIKPDEIYEQLKSKQEILTKLAQFIHEDASKLGININETKIMDRVHEELKQYQTIRDILDAYLSEQNRLIELFKIDLEMECGTSINPRKDLLYSKAYEKGHSSGLEEIVIQYRDLMELIL